jgi:Ca2+-binding EF-hand superfamily protein
MRFLGMHPTQEEISNIINEYDLDGDGHIDFS